jgi:16S rRNA (guanine966-N2)-methyltransferase
VRIIAGKFKGRRLAPLGKGDAAAQLRPTSDRVRESLFSLLAAKRDFDGLRVLDLFAGTGALGLEALSRGAELVVFVENGKVGQRLVARNIDILDVAGQARLLSSDATRLRAPLDRFDLVFLDPPYGRDLGRKALDALTRGDWLAPDAMIVWEEAQPQVAPPGLVVNEHRRFGDTVLTLLSINPHERVSDV